MTKKLDPFRCFETPWDGWQWLYGMYLVDPDGNRYSQEMIKSSIVAMQLQNELLGSSLKIYSLKQELERRLSLVEPEVILRWNGQETVLKLSAGK
jgi:hypothetical protein